MCHSNKTLVAIIAVLILGLVGDTAFAQRGRGGGGRGGRGGGGRVSAGARGGGFRGGSAMRAPAMRGGAARAPVARGGTMRAPAQGRNTVAAPRNFQPGRSAASVAPGRAGVNARPAVTPSARPGAVNTRSFGNTRSAGVNNRGPGNAGFAGNRAAAFGNTNNLNRTNFVTGRNVSGRGGYGGYHRSYGGYGRYGGLGYGGLGYGGLGYGGLGYGGLGYGGYGYGLGGWGFPLGLLLGYGLGGLGYGGYGGYGGGWGYPSYGYGGQGYGLGAGGLYSYGYLPYANPYYSTGSTALASVPYDYTQPIDVVSAGPPVSATEEAQTLFTAARSSFKAGNFASALQQADDALTRAPGDTSLHEFRALCLFALGRYDEAAVPLYAVLAVGPGWDWGTLIGLYPNVDVYTAQVRALESYIQGHPQSSASRFVLAYHYVTQGHMQEAAGQLRKVVALKPDDTLSAKLLAQLQTPAPSATGAVDSRALPEPSLATATGAPANVAPASTPMPEGATLAGTWTAHPAADSTITLSMQPDGAFQWKVSGKGQDRQFGGTSTFGNGLLTLVPENMPPLVGRLAWADATHMTFRALGDSPDSAGLSFSK